MQRMYANQLVNILNKDDQFNGIFLEKIRQVSPHDYVFEFNHRKNLFISLNQTAPFVDINIDTSILPPGGQFNAFGNELKHYLGGRLQSIKQTSGDTILTLIFEQKNNLFEKVETTLILELIPRHANAVITNTDMSILAAYKYSNINIVQQRLIHKNITYSYPKLISDNPIDKPAFNFYNTYVNDNYIKIIKLNYQPLFSHLDTNIKRLNKLIKNYEEDLLKTQYIDDLYTHATLLLTHKPQIFSNIVEIDGMQINVDPKYNAIDNANILFKKAKKIKKSDKILRTKIDETKIKIKEYKELSDYALTITDTDDFKTIYQQLGLLRSTEKNKAISKLSPYSIMYKDTRILFGKNIQQNDHLTHKIARINDTFMHIKNVPGSHIIIESINPSKDILEFAGNLALFLSKKVDGEVSYLPIKFVKKGQFPGQVILRNEKTIFLRFKEELRPIFNNNINRLK